MTDRVNSISADLIVVGGGGAGLTAAVAAAEKGLKNIIVLEERRAPGGNAVFPMGIFAAESRLQKKLGIDASRDVLFRKAMAYAHWKIDPGLVRALIDKSGDTIEWLEEKGVVFDRVYPSHPNQAPPVFHLCGETTRAGANIVKALIGECEARGVEIRCRTRVKKLLTGAGGEAAGVLAEADGAEHRFSAGSVVVATGGFAGNPALLKKHIPTYDETEVTQAGIPHRGDGVRMATEIGAAVEGMATLEMIGPVFPASFHVSILARMPHTLWVNRNGDRFTDESLPLFSETANSLFRQPGKISYSIFDEEIKRRIFGEALSPLDAAIVGRDTWPGKAEEYLQRPSDGKDVVVADTIDALGEKMGLPGPCLKKTVFLYNDFCEAGKDLHFAKDGGFLFPLKTPPFYGVRCCLNVWTTHGGIRINHRMEVLDGTGAPISGLYAAGVETGGWESDTYDVNLTGHSFGFTVNSGRIAGENAADRILRGTSNRDMLKTAKGAPDHE